MRRALVILPGFALALALSSCEREERAFRSQPGQTEALEQVALVSVAPGDAPPATSLSGTGAKFESNAYHVAQGKTLWSQMNCNGCHANGGGDSGPALIDDSWIYGSAIENIVHTIREGRPNGMPSFRGRIVDEQIWQLAAYVRAMGGFVAKDVAPGRNDDMHPRPAEAREPRVPARDPSPGGPPPQPLR